MPRIDPRRKAGPPGMGRISKVLMSRPGLVEPTLLRNANQRATNKYTARGVDDVALDYSGVPIAVENQLRLVEAKINEMLASERDRFLRERTT